MVLTTILLLLIAIIAIGKGSDWLTDSLIPLARKLGITGTFVGLILVSIAVSLPEVLVAVYAQINGYSLLSFGVVLGSITCNIGLMTGLSALAKPLRVQSHVILRDGIFSVVVPILVFAVGSSGRITRIEGLAFLFLFIPYVINVYLIEKQRTVKEKEQDLKEVEIELDLAGFEFGKIKSGWLSFILGLSLLLGGAYLFSNQLINLVKGFGINELLIGLTIGAIGPSIPNIITAFQATQKGMGEIAVSETLGSNIFTMLVTLGILALLSPISISSQWIRFDIPSVLFMSILLFFFIVSKQTISKIEGAILLFCYIVILLLQIKVI
ncbi:hypothetical protein A2960_05145 [Candidatus Gottesmanbacteria bacterium RIFCSPLOWO2_01_FULL_39_12b]|uniref:Sodium/calcium exchanger membrane region domain-containing protein n=1 Tax=Candidatus Gottesmanbacteria bacterium RIFCSPLOWO2_01_FULL_39_12b TaxID=1798388 RepID=A0A1F6ALZ1_9BACT|nr:MAG: hypothetical protein A2960_05145 [Candidatus Gottesmanbacteria bacterium RIFCSPLOWO2_01_FULL_39_12b]